ncbi:hypothetical protein [Methanopyrus sp.]
MPVLIGLILLAGPAQTADVPVDPTLGAGKVLVRFAPSPSGEWLAQVYYTPPKGKPAVLNATGSIAGHRIDVRNRYVVGRVAVVDVDEYAPELSGELTPVRVERKVTRDGAVYRVTLTVTNGSEHPVMVRLTYTNWTHLELDGRTLNQDVDVTFEGRRLDLHPFSIRKSRFVRADLVWTDAGSFRFPYARLKPGDSLTLHLDVTADRSPGKVTVTRRLLLSDSPIPANVDAEATRPVSFGMSGKRVSFWAPAPGVGYTVRYLVRGRDGLVPKTVTGTTEYQGVVSVELQDEPAFVTVYLRQPVRTTYEIRDRLRLPLRPGSDASNDRVWVRWTTRKATGGPITDVRVRGRAGDVLLGLVLDLTEGAEVTVDGGAVLERGKLPSGREFVVVDAGPVEGEKVVRVTSGARVLGVLARAVQRSGVA